MKCLSCKELRDPDAFLMPGSAQHSVSPLRWLAPPQGSVWVVLKPWLHGTTIYGSFIKYLGNTPLDNDVMALELACA